MNADVTDPNSEPNFNRPGRTPFIAGSWADQDATCTVTARYVGYQPFLFNLRIASMENGALIDSSANATAYDQATSNVWGSSWMQTVPSSSTPAYRGSYSTQAITFGLPAFGTFSTCATCSPATNTVKWDTSTDVWYGSAFSLPSGFTSQNHGLGIMRWQDPDDAGVYGGMFVDSTQNKLVLVHGNSTTRTTIGQAFDAPSDWFYLQVHQRFGSNPVSEVYVNGVLVTNSTGANSDTSNSTIANRVDYGFATLQMSQPTTLMFLDESFIDASERRAVGAPDTPIGFRVTTSNPTAGQPLSIAWNSVSPVVTGNSVTYRIYKKSASTDNLWVSIGDTSGTSYTDSDFCDPSSDYRVTARETNTLGSANSTSSVKESDAPAPLTVVPGNSPTC
jgi:hypothetical protein